MDEKCIEINGLTKKYGDHVAVDNLTLSINKGEIFGLLGPNGAGKSTTILSLLGLTALDHGSVQVCGINASRYPLEVKKKVGYLPEDVGFYNEYTGLQNLLYIARLNDIPIGQAKEDAIKVLTDVGLEEAMDNKVGSYSRGMRQRLGLADVLIKKPEVIILDEPTLGLDPEGVKKFLQLIVRLSRKKGITVLFSSHHLHQIQQVCDRVGIFVKGKLLAKGEISSLAAQLFSENAFTLELGISAMSQSLNEPPLTINALTHKIKGLKEVEQLDVKENHLVVGSQKDISIALSRLIVESGYGLSYLSKKEYGLDDIYHQYFQVESNS